MKNVSIVNLTTEGDLSNITTYQAGVFQAKMHRALQKQCDLILNDFGISKMHWLIIGTVLDSGKKGVRHTELAETLGTTMSYITSAINLLEVKGMVNRKDSDTDSRSKLISINSKFIPECARIEVALRDGLRKTIYATVNPEEFKIYMKVLYQLTYIDKTNTV